MFYQCLTNSKFEFTKFLCTPNFNNKSTKYLIKDYQFSSGRLKEHMCRD